MARKTEVEKIQEEVSKLYMNLNKTMGSIDKIETKLQKVGILKEVKNHLANNTFSDWWSNDEIDQNKRSLGFDYCCKINKVEEIQKEISKKENKLLKAIENEEKIMAKEDEFKKMVETYESKRMKTLEEEQVEWLKDGIILEGRYYGKTPKGNNFYISINNGLTERSNHCFTLRIDRKTIFTSGEFWKAYSFVKKS